MSEPSPLHRSSPRPAPRPKRRALGRSRAREPMVRKRARSPRWERGLKRRQLSFDANQETPGRRAVSFTFRAGLPGASGKERGGPGGKAPDAGFGAWRAGLGSCGGGAFCSERRAFCPAVRALPVQCRSGGARWSRWGSSDGRAFCPAAGCLSPAGHLAVPEGWAMVRLPAGGPVGRWAGTN